MIGDLLVRWGEELLVGFENHSARTYLGPTARPLGQVVIGHGNNGDGHEGVCLGHAVGTYLRGPCLPQNPDLADFLIRGALLNRASDNAAAQLQASRDVTGQGLFSVDWVPVPVPVPVPGGLPGGVWAVAGDGPGPLRWRPARGQAGGRRSSGPHESRRARQLNSNSSY